MHVGIAYLRWRGKHSRHSRRMRTRNFAYLARGPLFCRSWRIIRVTDKNCHLVPKVFHGVHTPTFGRPIYGYHSLVLWEIPSGSGACRVVHYLGPGQSCSERLLFSILRDFVTACICIRIHGAIQHNQFTFTTIVKSSPTMTDGLSLPSVPFTQTSMCLSPCCIRTRARPSVLCNLSLDLSMKIQCRKCQMPQTW